MIDPICKPCEQEGVMRKAHRIVGRTPMCNDHYLKSLVTPAAEPVADATRYARLPESSEKAPVAPAKEGTRMSTVIEETTIQEIRKLAGQGMSINGIATELQVSWPVVSKYAEGYRAKKSEGTTPAKKARRAKVNGAAEESAVQSKYSAVVQDLIAQRDKLNAAIDVLRAL
jgi:predicted transcriptional regulator